MRHAAVAGSFYPAEPTALQAAVEACFLDGPGSVPQVAPQRAGRVRGLVVPHAALQFSGAVAAHAYAALAADGLPDAYIILGPNHAGRGGMLDVTPDVWESPLGAAEVDADLLERAARSGLVTTNTAAHAFDHSIETQLPFLQYLAARADRAPPVRMLPMLLGLQDEQTARECGEVLASAIKETDRDVVVIASADFSHVGPKHHVEVPRGTDAATHARLQDARVLSALEALDAPKFLNAVCAHGVSSCGHGAVAAMVETTRRLGGTRARPLAYATSAEVEPGRSAVGYLAAVVE